LPVQPAEVRAITRRTRRIEGWFSAEAAALFGLLDEAQQRAKVQGDLFEIGVHHGRSAVLLSQLAGPGERLGVCDLFGEQTQNVSASGSGNRAIFEGNMAALAPGFDRLDVFATASDRLTPEEIGGPYRLFHVDGGHLSEEALADLRLGAEVLDPQGAIVIDDPFSVAWPGVTEGILHFLAQRPDFAPLILGYNKLVLTPTTARELYEPSVVDRDTWWRYFDHRVYDLKVLPIAGHPTHIVIVPGWRQHPELSRAVALMETFRHGLIYRVRARLGALRSAAGRPREP
jgi:Methyltransferase domain